MSSVKCLLAGVLALVLGLFSVNARADSSALVTFSGLEVALFDLDLLDGIDPTVALTQAERSGAIFQYANFDALGPPLREDRVTGTGSAAFSDANGSASVVLRFDAMEGEVLSTGGGAYTTLLTDSFRFTLAPYTRVVFSALTELAVSAETIQSALAVVTLEGQINSIPGQTDSVESTNVRFGSGSGAVPIAVEMASAGVPLMGNISLRGYAYARGVSPVSPVPEPGQGAMLLGGLAVLAAAWARRRRQALSRRGKGLRRVVAVAAIGLGGTMAGGMAQASSGSASIYDFAYELYDLDPADGMLPSLIFTSETASGTVNANNNPVLGLPWDETRILAGNGVEAIDKVPGRARVEATPGAIHASALAWRGAFSASSQTVFDFTLSPMTEVVFTALGVVVAASDNVTNPPDASGASAAMLGEVANFAGQRTQFSSYVALSAPGTATRSLAAHAFTGDLGGEGTLRLSAEAFAVGVSPIPEPGQWTMLLSGLALGAMRVARLANRKRQIPHAGMLR